jgi:hypothetical protein
MIRSTLMMLALVLVAACAAPYDMPAADRAGMEARVTQFQRDFAANNVPAIVDVVPPKMTDAIAARVGISPAKLRRDTIAQTRTLTKQVKVLSFGMATDQAAFRQTSAGRGYALIPTQSVIRGPDGRKYQSNNTTLAFKDAGQWYLVRIDEDAQRELLLSTYPEFQGLHVAPGTQKVVQ